MYCPYCGEENEEQATYCCNCGKKLEPETPPDQQKKPKKKSKKRGLRVLLVLLILVVIAGAALFLVSRRTSGTDDPASFVWQSDDNLLGMNAGFTDREITGEEAAILAAQDVADVMGYENAFDELTPFLSSTANDEAFYRLQETYQGIPVYQRYVTVVASTEGAAKGLYTDAVDIPEDVSLTPSLTEEAAKDAVTTYEQENAPSVSQDMTISDLCEEALIIYTFDDTQPARLAYQLIVENGGYETVVLDAQTGEVLEGQSMVHDNALTGEIEEDASVTFPVDYNASKDTYTMNDADRNITIRNLKDQDTGEPGQPKDANNKWNWDALIRGIKVTSTGNGTFGDTPEEQENDPVTAAYFLSNTDKVANWFADRERKAYWVPYGKIHLYYNCAFYNDKGKLYWGNAKGGCLPGLFAGENTDASDPINSGIMMLGAGFDGTELDTIAHEYTHIVQQAYDVADGENCAKALTEGLADTFSCLMRGEWDVDVTKAGGGHRNAEDPKTYGYPETITDSNQSLEEDDHAYATVLSHAAYFMYASGAFQNTDELADLWYGTLLCLPANCSYENILFAMCRKAENDGLSLEQQDAISEAFETVGIYSSHVDLNNKVTIKVKGLDEQPYDDYQVEINEVDIDGQDKKNEEGKMAEPETIVSESIKDTEPYTTELPDGNYEIRVTDNASYENKREQSYFVSISGEEERNQLDFDGFGAEYTVSPGATLTIVDANGEEVEYRSATMRMNTGDPADLAHPFFIDDGILNANKLNYYDLTIAFPKGLLNATDGTPIRTISHTVRVTYDGADTLEIQLPFTCVQGDESGAITVTEDCEVSTVTFIGDYMTKEAMEEDLFPEGTIEEIPYSRASLTLTNEKDTAYEVTVSYEYEKTGKDGESLGTDTELVTYYLAANEKEKPVYTYRRQEGDEEDETYTGNFEIEASPTDRHILPVDAVTGDPTFDSRNLGEVFVTFAVENTTSDNWNQCMVSYDVLYKNQYAGTFTATCRDLVSPGETATMSADLNDRPMYGYVGAYVDPDVVKDKLKFEIKNIEYTVVDE